MDESFKRILSSYKQGLLKQILDIDRQFIDEIKIVCPLCKTNKKKKEYKNAIFLEGSMVMSIIAASVWARAKIRSQLL